MFGGIRRWWARGSKETSSLSSSEDAATSEAAGCPIKGGNDPSNITVQGGGGCPVKEGQSSAPGEYNPLTGDYKFGQERQPDQKIPLGTHRQASTIPKGEITPAHQPSGHQHWVYPSEQQYFNAMKRKGWDPKEQDMPWVLAIHNAVNEQGWVKVKEWEAERGGDPKLKQFIGRPKDISPKAWFMSTILGYTPPFDRHDWIVESGGREVRYVIDFYKGKSTPERPVAMHLDVRPALDSFQDAFHRVRMYLKDEFGSKKAADSAHANTSPNSQQPA